MISLALLAMAVFLISFLGVFAIRRFAIRLKIQDIPNDRSSHKVPTPRGGGLGVVLLVVVFLFGALLSGLIPNIWGIALLAGTLVAGIGWIDDIRQLSAHTRAATHFVAAVAVAASLHPAAAMERILPFALPFPIVTMLVVLYLVWMTNLYNFMDGIDGIAAAEGISVTGLSATIAFQSGALELGITHLVVSAAIAGFLLHNWHPAKIFMGDVCSGFLGFILGVLAIWGAIESVVPFAGSLILMGTFVVDATYTLLVRLIRGERIYQAHRLHAYQKAARNHFSHAQVSTITVALNLFWLAPWAWVATKSPQYAWFSLIAAYVPLVLIELHLKAGIPETPNLTEQKEFAR